MARAFISFNIFFRERFFIPVGARGDHCSFQMRSATYKSEFRGWAIPGPVPPGDLGSGPALEAGETLDSISGHFRIFQLEKGHRFSTDDILTAWYGTSWSPASERVLDLGSGLGTVAMIAAWRLAGARFVTIEAQEEGVRLARKSVEWNGLGNRFVIRQGDFRDRGILAEDEQFGLILGSPPYFPSGAGIQGDHPQKVQCRFETRGDISDYCAAAAKHLAPGGFFACVFPVNPVLQHDRVRTAAGAAGLSIIRWRPVVLKESEPPLLGLFGMTRASDLPDDFRNNTWTEPPLIIRTKEGKIHPEYSAVKLAIGFPP
jgi:tRNA1(Val) A37 N6-methylase TrmN6